MEVFLQQLINGLTLGAIYGLIAIGYTMVYGIIGMINFAHGDIYMLGAFNALIGFLVLFGLGISWIPLAILLVLVITIVIRPPMAGRWSASPIAPCAARPAWRR